MKYEIASSEAVTKKTRNDFYSPSQSKISVEEWDLFLQNHKIALLDFFCKKPRNEKSLERICSPSQGEMSAGQRGLSLNGKNRLLRMNSYAKVHAIAVNNLSLRGIFMLLQTQQCNFFEMGKPMREKIASSEADTKKPRNDFYSPSQSNNIRRGVGFVFAKL
jgi:hypothetical protein